MVTSGTKLQYTTLQHTLQRKRPPTTLAMGLAQSVARLAANVWVLVSIPGFDSWFRFLALEPMLDQLEGLFHPGS